MATDAERLINDLLQNKWVWSVFTGLSSQGALASGIEDSREIAVQRLEFALTHQPHAILGLLSGGDGSESVCRNIGGRPRWLACR
jgi:hypothetical protein